ncbi:hypothetical protein ACFW9N_45655 [Streptomyces sp. NPDC059496]|uniref:hypothetical protein n=1 Tax=Streptomyces sp. NPDC059496 TaxID=3346851 RepID=UPI00368650F1
MTGRQRRIGGATMAAAVLAACGWSLDHAGYTGAAVALSLLAGAWRSGALDRLQAAPPAPPGARRRVGSAQAKADQERSMRLLKAIDEAAADGLRRELSEFERIVLFGVAELPGQDYPPPGHGYPRP